MKRRTFLAAVAPLIALGAPVQAQLGTAATGDTTRPITGAARARPAPTGAPVEPPEGPANTEQKKEPRGVTEITSREAMLDNRKHLATFNGDVVVKDPQYNLTCDKLTVYLKAKKNEKNEKDGKPAQPAPIGADPEPAAKPGDPVAKPGEKQKDDGDGGGIERAVAEGNVEIIQEKVDANGKKQRYFGKARRAVFDNDKKTCILYGWPRIAQSTGEGMGKETFALQENTVITLDQAGTINVDGLSRTRLTDLSGFELKEKDNGNR